MGNRPRSSQDQSAVGKDDGVGDVVAGDQVDCHCARSQSRLCNYYLWWSRSEKGTGRGFGRDSMTEIGSSEFLDLWKAYRCLSALLPLRKPWFLVLREFVQVEAGPSAETEDSPEVGEIPGGLQTQSRVCAQEKVKTRRLQGAQKTAVDEEITRESRGGGEERRGEDRAARGREGWRGEMRDT